MNESVRFTTTELRLITGIPAKNLNTYKLRGKIYRDSQGMWPLNNDINRSFIELKGIPGQLEKIIAQQGQKEKKKVESKKKPTKTVKPKKKPVQKLKKVASKKNLNRTQKEPNKKKPVQAKGEQKKRGRPLKPKEEIKISEAPAELSELAKVQLEQKKLSIEKAKSENELKKIELEQKRGSLIELEKTISITQAYSDKFKRGLLEDIKILIQDICARHDIDTGKTGEYKLKIADIINDRSEKVTKELLKQFK